MQSTSNLFSLVPRLLLSKKEISLKLNLISQICTFWIKYHFITVVNGEKRNLFLDGLILLYICDIKFLYTLCSLWNAALFRVL